VSSILRRTHVDQSIQSVVTFEVKPWDDETDMAELEKAVRSIEWDGLVWGASKLVPIGYGLSSLTFEKLHVLIAFQFIQVSRSFKYASSFT